jgi:hypothetical protein
MPKSTFVEISPEQYTEMLAALWRVSHGTHLSRRHPGPGVQRPRPAHLARVRVRAGTDAAPLASGHAQSARPAYGWC